MHQTVPAIHKPTATMLIDDDDLYIDNIKALLPNNDNTFIVNPEDFIPIYNTQLFALNNGRTFKPLSSSEILTKEHGDIPVSVIVMDHFMTPTNGLDVLRQIKSPFVQKILISNFFTNERAIDALNQKIINCYLCKMDPQFVLKLTQAIENAQKQFFLQLSSLISDFLSEENPLFEPKTAELFQKIKSDYGVPYHQASSDLKQFEFFSTKDTNKIVMNILAEEDIEALLNSYNAESAPSELLSLIKSGAVLPCGKNGVFPEGKDWPHHLTAANSFKGKKRYFYTIYETDSNGERRSMQ